MKESAATLDKHFFFSDDVHVIDYSDAERTEKTRTIIVVREKQALNESEKRDYSATAKY
jgi:hypothetical protein